MTAKSHNVSAPREEMQGLNQVAIVPDSTDGEMVFEMELFQISGNEVCWDLQIEARQSILMSGTVVAAWQKWCQKTTELTLVGQRQFVL